MWLATLSSAPSHLGLEKLALFGHSSGAKVVLGYAERVEKLMLVELYLEEFDDSESFKTFAAET
jgi:pimeloyl-ACP methyl ester carboxylesterase